MPADSCAVAQKKTLRGSPSSHGFCLSPGTKNDRTRKADEGSEPFRISYVPEAETHFPDTILFIPIGDFHMTAKSITVIAALLATAMSLSSCGNTIRGVGRDTANTVNATQDAGRSVERAAR
jgi:entericidin B